MRDSFGAVFIARHYSSHFQKTSNTRKLAWTAIMVLLGFTAVSSAEAQDEAGRFVLARENRTIAIEPYGPGIVRVTLSGEKPEALAAPGYGIVGTPSMTGWAHEQDSEGYDVIRSGQLTVRVAPENLPGPHHFPLDSVNQSLRDIYFPSNGARNGPYDDIISITTATGKPLLTMGRWSMFPNHSETAPGGADRQGKVDPGYRVSATFDSPTDEHYFGLGQQQQGALDLRDHRIDCWHAYEAIGGEDVCVPFMVSSRGYGLIWDNPSKTTIDLGFNQQNIWSSEVGDRVSFFVIAGEKSDEIYQGYRQLTGITHLLPKAAYGYIQSKAIYPTQEQLLDVAKGYRDRQLPLDVFWSWTS
jgi:alpha-D-xyloside xylohydrolase